ncbi:8761_t:CDS:2 [Entrophospora sp. SA101]|nr:8761_t:CDS:2 [Entrophospora sp. SA101]
MSRADNSIDLDNGQSSLVINQPDHLQQQLMFTQDEFQQFPSELSQDDWNSQLFNYINGSNANNDEDANSSDNYDMVSLQPQSIAPRRSIMISPQPPLPQLLLQQHQEPPTPTSPLDAFPILSIDLSPPWWGISCGGHC